MQINAKKILLLIFVFSLLLTTVGFCGSWYTIDLKQPPIMQYQTKSFYSYGEPTIKFWSKSRYGKSTIKVTLYTRQYIAKPISEGGGWKYLPTKSTTSEISSTRDTLVMLDYRDGFLRSDAYYKIEVINGPSVSIDGEVTYYK